MKRENQASTLAAPVALGMMLALALRPPRQSLLDGPSTVFCVAARSTEKFIYINESHSRCQDSSYIFQKKLITEGHNKKSLITPISSCGLSMRQDQWKSKINLWPRVLLSTCCGMHCSHETFQDSESVIDHLETHRSEDKTHNVLSLSN